MADTARSMFAEELQARREAAGLTQEQLAQKALMSASLLRKIETTKRRPQSDFAAWCDKFFGCPGTFRRFHRMTLLETFPDWFAPRMLYEEQATMITEWEIRGVPGLLQTPTYAAAMVKACRPFDSDVERSRTVEARIERQEILARENPPQLWVLLSEGAIRQIIGSPAIMRAQLSHLAEVSATSKCVIQILPFKSLEAPAPEGPACLFEFPDRKPVVYLEGWNIGWLVEDPGQVTSTSTTLSMIKGCALSPAESRNLMIKIRDEL